MTKSRLKFGVFLSSRTVAKSATDRKLTASLTKGLFELAKAAEEGGFECLFLGDSLYKLPRLESITLLSALASKTEKVKLGTCCMASFPLREPYLLALQWATLDQVSVGRTILGVCAGGPIIRGEERGGGRFFKEWEMMGKDYRHRGEMLEENIIAIRKLWTEEHLTYDGKFVKLKDVTLEPKPYQNPPPIWIANNLDFERTKPEIIERSFRRTAKFADGWMTACDLVDFEKGLNVLNRHLKEESPSKRMEIALQNGFNLNPDGGNAMRDAKRFLDTYYLTSHSETHLKSDYILGSYDDCISRVQDAANHGATTMILRPVSANPMEQLKRAIDNVLPSFL